MTTLNSSRGPARRRATRIVAMMAVALLHSNAADCSAQLFGGSRQLGQPIEARQQSRAESATADAGRIQGNERFLRSNRRRGDFVGSDRFERRGFVGSQQGSANGPVLPSVVGVRPGRDRSAQINRPLTVPPRSKPYHPRLTIGFDSPIATGILPGSQLLLELENPDFFSSSNQFEVSVEGRTAILRGVVADERERDLVELLVSFEPGISAVRNLLTTPDPMPARPSPQPVAAPPELAPPRDAATPAPPSPTVPNR